MVMESRKQLENKQRQRRPVNECYCYSRAGRVKPQPEKTIEDTALTCACCTSRSDAIEKNLVARVNMIRNVCGTALTPISCETFRRAAKICYAPQSEFLRRVQKKISGQKMKSNCSCSEFSTTSSSRQHWTGVMHDSCKGLPAARVSCHSGKCIFGKVFEGSERRLRSEFRTNHEIQSLNNERRSVTACDENRGRNANERTAVLQRQPQRSKSISINDRRVIKTDEKNDVRKDLGLTRKLTSSMKKVVRSSECLKNQQRRFERSPLKHVTKNKRIVRTISGFSRCCGNDQPDDNMKNLDPPRAKIELKKKNNLFDREEHDETTCQLSRIKNDIVELSLHDVDHKFSDLNAFRQQNYFDTHGSAQTLFTSSSLSESSDQCYSNERLYHEPIRKDYHKECAAATTPRATNHRKLIQHCPKHVAKQEKGISNTNYGKKIPPKNGGLSGHLLDLGIIRIPCHVSNSLTVKYQKPLVIRNH